LVHFCAVQCRLSYYLARRGQVIRSHVGSCIVSFISSLIDELAFQASKQDRPSTRTVITLQPLTPGARPNGWRGENNNKTTQGTQAKEMSNIVDKLISDVRFQRQPRAVDRQLWIPLCRVPKCLARPRGAHSAYRCIDKKHQELRPTKRTLHLRNTSAIRSTWFQSTSE
jgi:hypothetical protein